MAEAETGDGEAEGRAVTDFFRKNLTLNVEKRPHQINFLCCMRSLVFIIFLQPDIDTDI